jgi:subtilisin family serine protease
MKRAISALFLLVFAGFGQSGSRLVDYALLLEDAPVAQKTQGRLALQSADAQAQMARIRSAQDSLLAELQRRKVTVGGSSQVLVNAIFVRTTPETAAQLLHLPGVVHVVRAPRLHRDLNTALGLVNVPGAWSAITGGAANAGAGIKIGIIDTGIDQNHPGFQDTSLAPPAVTWRSTVIPTRLPPRPTTPLRAIASATAPPSP